MTNEGPNTPSVSIPPLNPDTPASERAVRVDVDVAGMSDRGLTRENNEDHFLISRLERTWRVLQTNVATGALVPASTDTVYGLIVADGMGGHAAGEVASRTAITCFVDMVLRTPNLITRLDDTLTEHALQRMTRRFEAIKEALVEAVQRDPSLQGMGTTMTLAASFGADAIIAHVGDSRAYLLRRGELQRLTHDQTMGQFLKDTGVLSEAELAAHPLRHVLTGVLGTQGSPLDVDVRGVHLEDGDQLLLCTDGLTEMIGDEAIRDALRGPHATAADACQRLVNLAIGNGGRDNVTVVVARYRISA
jgi:PPM family protein phosphatase